MDPSQPEGRRRTLSFRLGKSSLPPERHPPEKRGPLRQDTPHPRANLPPTIRPPVPTRYGTPQPGGSSSRAVNDGGPQIVRPIPVHVDPESEFILMSPPARPRTSLAVDRSGGSRPPARLEFYGDVQSTASVAGSLSASEAPTDTRSIAMDEVGRLKMMLKAKDNEITFLHSQLEKRKEELVESERNRALLERHLTMATDQVKTDMIRILHLEEDLMKARGTPKPMPPSNLRKRVIHDSRK